MSGLANFRDATQRLEATASHAEDLYSYALALHYYKVRLFPQYRDAWVLAPTRATAYANLQALYETGATGLRIRDLRP